jgi:hypothetical protein
MCLLRRRFLPKGAFYFIPTSDRTRDSSVVHQFLPFRSGFPDEAVNEDLWRTTVRANSWNDYDEPTFSFGLAYKEGNEASGGCACPLPKSYFKPNSLDMLNNVSPDPIRFTDHEQLVLASDVYSAFFQQPEGGIWSRMFGEDARFMDHFLHSKGVRLRTEVPTMQDEVLMLEAGLHIVLIACAFPEFDYPHVLQDGSALLQLKDGSTTKDVGKWKREIFNEDKEWTDKWIKKACTRECTRLVPEYANQRWRDHKVVNQIRLYEEIKATKEDPSEIGNIEGAISDLQKDDGEGKGKTKVRKKVPKTAADMVNENRKFPNEWAPC